MTSTEGERTREGGMAAVLVAWLLVGIPLAWGVFTTIKKAALLFK